MTAPNQSSSDSAWSMSPESISDYIHQLNLQLASIQRELNNLTGMASKLPPNQCDIEKYCKEKDCVLVTRWENGVMKHTVISSEVINKTTDNEEEQCKICRENLAVQSCPNQNCSARYCAGCYHWEFNTNNVQDWRCAFCRVQPETPRSTQVEPDVADPPSTPVRRQRLDEPGMRLWYTMDDTDLHDETARQLDFGVPGDNLNVFTPIPPPL